MSGWHPSKKLIVFPSFLFLLPIFLLTPLNSYCSLFQDEAPLTYRSYVVCILFQLLFQTVDYIRFFSFILPPYIRTLTYHHLSHHHTSLIGSASQTASLFNYKLPTTSSLYSCQSRLLFNFFIFYPLPILSLLVFFHLLLPCFPVVRPTYQLNGIFPRTQTSIASGAPDIMAVVGTFFMSKPPISPPLHVTVYATPLSADFSPK